MLLRRLQLVPSLVDAVGLDGARNVDLHAHVHPREGIVAAVQAGGNLGRLVGWVVGQGVDVGGEGGRRGCV
jgi:hypothetical protein